MFRIQLLLEASYLNIIWSGIVISSSTYLKLPQLGFLLLVNTGNTQHRIAHFSKIFFQNHTTHSTSCIFSKSRGLYYCISICRHCTDLVLSSSDSCVINLDCQSLKALIYHDYGIKHGLQIY